jgi:hypothetical protein
VGLALLNYHDTHGRFPPAAVCGEDGKPLYSWRVMVLPFIEQDGLFKKFHLDESWDSPHNILLVEQMPRTYALSPRKAAKLGVPPGHTIMHVFVGRDAPFEGKEGLRIADFTDGLSNTILVIEAGKPVPWTKPEDLPFDPNQPLPDLPSPFRDGFRVNMADGSTIWVNKNIYEATLRAAITRNWGDVLGGSW